MGVKTEVQLILESWKPKPVLEYRFYEGRKFAFDACWPERLIALEVDGGVFGTFNKFGAFERGVQGRHNRPAGFSKDQEKRNLAGLSGYRLFSFSPRQILNGEAEAFMRPILTAQLSRAVEQGVRR